MTYPIWQVIIFIIIDLIIFLSIIAGIFFLILFINRKKLKKTTTVNLDELNAFKNKDLIAETNASLDSGRPISPSTFDAQNQNNVFANKHNIPVRTRQSQDSSGRLFNQQMQQNNQFMNDSFVTSQNTNFFNM